MISGVPAAAGDLQYALGFKCLPNNTVTAAGGTRYVALVVGLKMVAARIIARITAKLDYDHFNTGYIYSRYWFSSW